MSLGANREPDADGEIVEFGRPARRRRFGVMALACLVVAAVVVVAVRPGQHAGPAGPRVPASSAGLARPGTGPGGELSCDQGDSVPVRFATAFSLAGIARTAVPQPVGDGMVSLGLIGGRCASVRSTALNAALLQTGSRPAS